MRVPGSRRARAAVLAALVVIVGVSVWVVRERGDARTVEAAVRAFFDARQRGDCDRLRGLVSEESWSAGGQLGRDDFRHECMDAVEDYRPTLTEVEVVSDDGDEAVVNVSVEVPDRYDPGPAEGVRVGTLGEDGRAYDVVTRAYETGHLHREDGRWVVESDDGLFRLGRSIEETVSGFVGTFNDGDCEHLLDYLSDGVWSEDGQLGRTDYLAGCAEAAEARRALPDAFAAIDQPGSIEIGIDPNRHGSATARWASQEVSLVKEGLEWKLDSIPAAVERIDLATQLVADVPWPGFHRLEVGGVSTAGEPFSLTDFSEGSDVAERRAEAGFEQGAVAIFGSDDSDHFIQAVLVLYEFADEDGAHAYAELLASRVDEQAARGSAAQPSSTRDVHGAVVYCGSGNDGCQHAEAAAGVAVDGRFVTAVEVQDSRDPAADQLLSQVDEVLHAQLDRI
jgi:ketosteroid isomerase-like protein